MGHKQSGNLEIFNSLVIVWCNLLSTSSWKINLIIYLQVENALLTHWWYQGKFKEYPKRRRAIIPLILWFREEWDCVPSTITAKNLFPRLLVSLKLYSPIIIFLYIKSKNKTMKSSLNHQQMFPFWRSIRKITRVVVYHNQTKCQIMFTHLSTKKFNEKKIKTFSKDTYSTNKHYEILMLCTFTRTVHVQGRICISK